MLETGPKKRRLQNACDECRRRKIRCNSAETLDNICSNCIGLKIKCLHNSNTKKPGPKIGSSVRALVHNILSTATPFIVPEDLGVVKQMLTEISNYARNLERQLVLLRKRHSVSEDGKNGPPDSGVYSLSPKQTSTKEFEDSIDSLTSDLDMMRLPPDLRLFGKSSNFMLVQTAMDAKRSPMASRTRVQDFIDMVKRPQYWSASPITPTNKSELPTVPFIFPPHDLLHDLIEIYFLHVNSIYPLFHRPTFERSIRDNLHLRDRGFGSTLLGVCAIASARSSDPRNAYTESEATHGPGWKYFRQIPLNRDLGASPSVHYIQLCCLCGLYLQTPEPTWTIIGFGIRSAQELGKHLQQAAWGNRAENELWKRAFWVLILLDSFMSMMMGRPRATTSEDFDVDLPAECDDDYWENDDPSKAFVQPEGKPSIMSFFIGIIKLVEILNFGQRTLYSVNKTGLWAGMGTTRFEWKQRAVVELDSALNKFVDEVPEHLKWDLHRPDPLFFQQSAMMWSLYYYIQIQVHRPFIPRPGKEPVLPFPSLSVCCSAARKALMVLEAMNSRSDNRIAAERILIMPVFSATMILLVKLWLPESRSHVDNEKDFGYLLAGRLADIMTAVLRIGELPLPTNLSSAQTQDNPPFGAPMRYPPRVEVAPSLLSQPTLYPNTQSNFSLSSPNELCTYQVDLPVFQNPIAPASAFLGPGDVSTHHDTRVAETTTYNQLTPEDWDIFMANIDIMMASAVDF